LPLETFTDKPLEPLERALGSLGVTVVRQVAGVYDTRPELV
jgi:hypothetical protein